MKSKDNTSFLFTLNLTLNNTIFKDDYNIVECKQSDHHVVTSDL